MLLFIIWGIIALLCGLFIGFVTWESKYSYAGRVKEGLLKARTMAVTGGLAVALAVFFVGWGVAAGFVWVAGAETHEGYHYGYVTSVESGGLLVKTTTVYFKTDLESTQEDTYCVESGQVADQLNAFAKSETRVRITFTTHLLWSDGCVFDSGDTIRGVQAV